MTREERNRRRRERYAESREAIREQQKRYVAANAEKVAARKAAYYQRTREKWLAYFKAKYEAETAAILARQRARRERPDYAEAQAERLRKWHELHPNARGQYDQRRRARLRGVEVEAVERELVWERDGGLCRICGDGVVDPSGWHLDHIVPICKGGGHTFDNLAVTHPACNLRKSTADPREPGSPYAYLLEPEAS